MTPGFTASCAIILDTVNEYRKTSVHAMLAARRTDSTTAVGEAVDTLFVTQPPGGPMKAEVLDPLLQIAGEVGRLREGRLGPLTVEQWEALNLIHGRLSQISLVLRELHDGTALASKQPYLEEVATTVS